MRLVIMSDTHMLHRRLVVPAGDIVVHCGDWSGDGAVSDYDDFFSWFAELPHAQKILVAGNHDELMQQFNRLMRRRIPSSVTYLEDEGATVDGLRFWGSPWTPGIVPMAFTHGNRDDIDARWAKIPDDVDVLVTHGPPNDLCDSNYGGQHIGDPKLLARVEQVRPKLHVFGHVHESNGKVQRGGTLFVNAAIGDDSERANLSSRIWFVDLDEGGDVSASQTPVSSVDDAIAVGIEAMRAAGTEPTAWAYELADRVIAGEMTLDEWKKAMSDHY